MTVKTKIIAMGVAAAFLPVVVILGILMVQQRSLNTQVGNSLDGMIKDQLSTQVKDVYALCQTQQDTIQKNLKNNLKVAEEIVKTQGGYRVLPETVEWEAKNQLNQVVTKTTLPKVTIGDTWLGQERDKEKAVAIVDDVFRLTGSTCTIFQRMNERGDMLRIATNVISKEGKRAIGTYIPTANLDGVSNPVLSTVLSGGVYVGRAFVVDRWYVAAYEPIKDAQGSVIGMIYVGIPFDENTVGLRKAVMDMKVGKSGYVYVLAGSGDAKGQYIISKDGKRDGENIWNAKDSGGNLFIQTIVNEAVKLGDREVIFQRYPWKNEGDTVTKDKIAAIEYFKPWDWVVAASAYEDDISTIRGETKDAINGMILAAVIAGLVFFVISLLVAFSIGNGIAAPLTRLSASMMDASTQTTAAAMQVSTAAQQISQGATEQAASLEETSSSLDEMSSMTKQNADNAVKANQMALEAKAGAEQGNKAMQEMQGSMKSINESTDKISKIIKSIEEISFQTNLLALNAAVEAARAGEHGKGFAVVADEVRNLAQRAAASAKDTAALIEDSINKVKVGNEISKKAGEALNGIMGNAGKVADIISEIAAASKEQAEGIGQVTNAVSQMDQVTQQNASASEEAAASAEELTSQAESLKGMVADLQAVVSGSRQSEQMLLSHAGSAGQERRTPAGQHAVKVAHLDKPKAGAHTGTVRKDKKGPHVIKPEDVIPLDGDKRDFKGF